MRHPWIIIAVAILVGLSIWLYIGISSVFKAERDLVGTLDLLAQHYVSMDALYLEPLQSNTALPPADLQVLREVSDKYKALAQARDADAKLNALIAVQRTTIDFFWTPGLPDAFILDSRFTNWNKEASNQGKASELLRNYNVTLSLYNARLQSTAGKIAGYWRTMEKRPYLGIDGSLQGDPQVTF